MCGLSCIIVAGKGTFNPARPVFFGPIGLTGRAAYLGYYYNYTAELKMEDINTDPNAKPIKFDVTVDKWKDTTPGDDLNLTDKKN